MTRVTAYRSVLVLGSLAFALSACASDRGERFLGDWERDGRGVPGSEVVMSVGPAHCDWEQALILAVPWPPDGDRDEGMKRLFVRDPDGVMADYTDEAFVADADLPDDAEPTGFENDAGIELWLAEDGSTAYLVDADVVEAWPVLDEETFCA
jgi:hypothetical protein